MTQPLAPLQTVLLALGVAALLALRLWFHLSASPLPDEAYYWLWGRNPDWSYFDHPPLQAWMQAISHQVFGTSLFALRLPAVVTSGIVFGCLVWWGQRLRAARQFPLICAAIILGSPLMFLMTGMAFNDHLLIALLSLATIQLYLMFDGQMRRKLRLRHLYLAAVLIGLAGLTKYNSALFALGALAMIVTTRALRPLLRNPHLYFAGALTLACLAPVFWWNIDHSGASFQYNLQDRLTSAPNLGAYVQRVTGFSVGFCVALSPILFGAVLGLYWRRNLPSELALLRRMALWIFAVSGIACLILSYWVAVIYYWNVIAVVALLPLLGFTLRPKWLAVHMVFGLIVNAALVFNHTVIPLTALVGGVDDESALMYGWPQISAAVRAQASAKGDFIVTTDYRTGAILGFWLDKPDVSVIAARISQFTLWLDPAQHIGQDAIILSSAPFPITELMSNQFDRIEDLGAIKITRFGHIVAEYALHRGIHFRRQ